MLGPVRFQHIETCSREVCQLFIAREQAEEQIPILESLDDEIVTLRTELGRLTNPAPDKGIIVSSSSTAVPTLAVVVKKLDYTTSLLEPRPDPAKAQRLVRARQGTINSLKASISRQKTTPTPPT